MSAQLRIGLLFFLALLVFAMWLATFASKRQERVIEGIAPLENRNFEGLTLVTVGSGGSFENHHRSGPALLVGHGETALLVDAGRGVSEALRAASVPARQPRHLLLTSLAAENLIGFDDLWLDAWLHHPREPLRVYGPPGTARFVAGIERAHRESARALGSAWQLEAPGGRLIAQDIEAPLRLEIGGIQIRSAAIAGGNQPALAWRFEHDDARGDATGHAIVVAPGGADADAIATFARGAALLVVEGVYGASLALAEEAGVPGIATLRREAATHLRLEDIGAIANRAEVGAVVLTRLRPPPVFDFQYENLVARSFGRGPVFVAADGESFTP